MSDETHSRRVRDITRRKFLSSAILPLAAAMTPSVLLAQEALPAAKQDKIRVGIVGAGSIVRSVHIPGLRRMPKCEVVAVANRSLESSRRAAAELGIPRAYRNWEQLLEADGIDAVLIGTWPYMHRSIALAALERGKHVFCQARMANDAAEAREMLAASQQHPDLVCQLAPKRTSYKIDRALQRLIGERYIGDILSVDIQYVDHALLGKRDEPDATFADFDGEFDWRHDPEFSGYNMMDVGGTYESAMRWLGPGNRIMAITKVQVPRRRDAQGNWRTASIPDYADVLYELGNGAPVHMKFAETAGLSAGNQIWIYGSDGTIHVDRTQRIFVGRRGDKELREFPNLPEHQFHHRAEEEFINAIRGIEKVTLNTFDIGVQYMDFTEAVHRSAASGKAVYLPLSG
jgi:predicted dehydrogenase